MAAESTYLVVVIMAGGCILNLLNFAKQTACLFWKMVGKKRLLFLMTDSEPDKTQLTIAAYKDVFSADDAKAKLVLEDLSGFCLENFDIFVENSGRKTDFNLGANSVIRHIRYMLKRKTEKKQGKVISERKIL